MAHGTPTASAAHIDSSKTVLLAALIISGALGFAAIGGGIVAIIWNAKSPTQFNFLGMSLTTGDVGVAMVAVGVVSLVLVVRRTMKALERLGALP